MKYFLLSISILILNSFKAQNFQWAKQISGPNLQYVNSTCVDASGNTYSIGQFVDVVDFDPGPGTFSMSPTPYNFTDIYILKLDALGNFVWAKKIGADGFYDFPGFIALDNNGDLLITGSFNSTVDFDPGASVFNLTSAGEEDAFVLKLNAQGNFIWAKQIGGINSDGSYALKIDSQNNIFFSGYYSGTVDLNPEGGVFNATSNGANMDIFIEKLNSTGNFLWAKSIGGVENEFCSSITLDVNNNIYALGTFSGTVDFDPSVSVANKTSNGGKDIFIEKFDNSGNMVWINTFGGAGNENTMDVKLDSQSNLYLSLSFQNTVDFNPLAGVFNLTSNGGSDLCLQKLTSAGNFVWAKQFGGINNEYGGILEINSLDNLFLAGSFEGTVDLDPSFNVNNFTSNSSLDLFIESIDKDGNLVWVTSIGGTDAELPYCLALDNNNNLFLGGVFWSTVDFDPSSSTFNLTSVDNSGDDFILKLSQGFVGIKESNNLVLRSNIYPNPTTDNFVVTLEEASSAIDLEIYTVSGQLIYKQNYSNTNQIHLNIEQPKGVYFVVLKDDKGNKSNLKLVKI
jgi:hypothetical protein